MESPPIQDKMQDQPTADELPTTQPPNVPKPKKKFFVVGFVILLFVFLLSLATYRYVVNPSLKGSVVISTDKKVYKVGETINVIISSKDKTRGFLDGQSYCSYISIERKVWLSWEVASDCYKASVHSKLGIPVRLGYKSNPKESKGLYSYGDTFVTTIVREGETTYTFSFPSDLGSPSYLPPGTYRLRVYDPSYDPLIDRHHLITITSSTFKVIQ